MVILIPEFASNKVKKQTQDWRTFFGSIDYALHMILHSDYGSQISDEVTQINQRIIHRFNGQYSHYYLKELKKTNKVIDNLAAVADMIDDIIFLQFSHDSIKSIIEEKSELLAFNPLLRLHLADIIQYRFKSMKLSQLESLFDLECKDNKYEAEEDAMIEIIQEGNEDEEDENGDSAIDIELEVGDDYELKDNLRIGAVVAALQSEEKEANASANDAQGPVTRARAARMHLDANGQNESNQNNISIDSIFSNENESHWISECNEETCEGYWIQCHCGKWCCETHIKEKILKLSKIRTEPIELDLDAAVTPATMDSLSFFCCWTCNDYLSEIMRNFVEFLRSFIKYHYSDESGRNKVADIKTSSDYAWNIVAVDRLIELYLSDNCDDTKWKARMQNVDWMKEGLELFMTLVKKWRVECNDSIFSVLVSNNDIEIQAEIIILKKEIMQFIMAKKALIEPKDDWKKTKRMKQMKKFRALLWKQIDLMVKNELRHLTLLHELEQKKAYCECIIESLCSHLKNIVDKSVNKNSDWDSLTRKTKNKLFQPKKWNGQEIHRQAMADGFENTHKRLGIITNTNYLKNRKPTVSTVVDHRVNVTTETAFSLDLVALQEET